MCVVESLILEVLGGQWSVMVDASLANWESGGGGGGSSGFCGDGRWGDDFAGEFTQFLADFDLSESHEAAGHPVEGRVILCPSYY